MEEVTEEYTQALFLVFLERLKKTTNSASGNSLSTGSDSSLELSNYDAGRSPVDQNFRWVTQLTLYIEFPYTADRDRA